MVLCPSYFLRCRYSVGVLTMQVSYLVVFLMLKSSWVVIFFRYFLNHMFPYLFTMLTFSVLPWSHCKTQLNIFPQWCNSCRLSNRTWHFSEGFYKGNDLSCHTRWKGQRDKHKPCRGWSHQHVQNRRHEQGLFFTAGCPVELKSYPPSFMSVLYPHKKKSIRDLLQTWQKKNNPSLINQKWNPLHHVSNHTEHCFVSPPSVK